MPGIIICKVTKTLANPQDMTQLYCLIGSRDQQSEHFTTQAMIAFHCVHSRLNQDIATDYEVILVYGSLHKPSKISWLPKTDIFNSNVALGGRCSPNATLKLKMSVFCSYCQDPATSFPFGSRV